MPSCQGTSIGYKLLARYLEDAQRCSNVKGVFLTTDNNNNEKVINFYNFSGFNIYSTFCQSPSRPMVALIYYFENM